MSIIKKRKWQVYDPGLPPPPLPFKNAAAGAECDFCGSPADYDVNLPGTYVGILCGGCKKKRLPYPYNGEAVPPRAGADTPGKKDAGAIFEEGTRYYSGDGVDKDRVKALELFTEAARLGHAEAQHNVGICHKSGRYGKALDILKAAWWFEKAAVQGYTAARHDLGKYYLSGGGGYAPDYVKAVKWLTLAADAGNADSQNDLGKCYAEGKGVGQDYKKAKAWWKKAAAQGNTLAAENLETLKALKKRR